MPIERKMFHCLRCQHRFAADYEKGTVVERSCPECGSNSVRLPTEATPAKPATEEAAEG